MDKTQQKCTCGGKLQKFGWRKTKEGKFRQYRCKDCKKFVVDRSNLGGKPVKGQEPQPNCRCTLTTMEDSPAKAVKAPPPAPDNPTICKFAYSQESPPMSRITGGFICAVGHHVRCNGSAKERQACPLWSGTGRFV